MTNLGLWAVSAPPPPQLNAFEGEHDTDVAVIGGGYTGLSAALHLAQSECQVTLLEAKEIGFGGSGRNVGLVNAGLWMFPDDVVKALGPNYGERLLTVLGNSPDLVFELIEKYCIQCEAVRKGTLHCAHSPGGYRQLQTRYAQWARRGAPVRLLERHAAALKIGSNAFYGALLDMRAGTVHPLAYAYGLAHAAIRSKARLFSASPVTNLKRANGKWHLSTLSGTLTARAVIMATGGYTENLRAGLSKTYIPFNFFQFSTPPLLENVRRTILPDGQGAWDTNLVLSSYRLDQAGRLIIGSVGLVDRFAYGLHSKWVQRTLKKVFPQIGRIPLEHAWHGRIAMTVDHIPRLYQLDSDLAMITNYNGRGIGPGTVFGKALAEFVLSGSPKKIPLPVSTPQPIHSRRLRGIYYEAGARIYHFLQRRM